jgi:hypothetical protein
VHMGISTSRTRTCPDRIAMQNVNTVRPRTDMAIYLPLVPTARHRPDVSNTRRHQHRDDSRGDELWLTGVSAFEPRLSSKLGLAVSERPEGAFSANQQHPNRLTHESTASRSSARPAWLSVSMPP